MKADAQRVGGRALCVLHVSFSDLQGGAARAAWRLHRGLLKLGIDSRMLVVNKCGNDEGVLAPQGRAGRSSALLRRRLEALVLKLQRSGNPILHSLNILPSGLLAHIEAMGPDIVNLHWLGAGTLSISEVAAIDRPLVWTLHDMWAFCGAEHYEDPSIPPRRVQAYARASRSPRHRGLDIDGALHRYKAERWAGRTLHLACPSRWMEACAGESALFAHQPRRVLPNGIDIEVYAPQDRMAARRAYGLPLDKRLIAFCALSAGGEPRKGLHLLIPALRRLGRLRTDVELVVFGAPQAQTPDVGMLVHHLGRIDADEDLARLYAAADVFVSPSMQDNLPNTLVEALACGTPCVAFATGGMPDLVVHGGTGYLASPFDSEDLAQGLVKVLADSENMRSACRRYAEEHFADTLAARSYADWYEAIVRSFSDGSP